jgi:hypothetical protein
MKGSCQTHEAVLIMTVKTTKMLTLTNAEFADTHFMYGFYEANPLTALSE